MNNLYEFMAANIFHELQLSQPWDAQHELFELNGNSVKYIGIWKSRSLLTEPYGEIRFKPDGVHITRNLQFVTGLKTSNFKLEYCDPSLHKHLNKFFAACGIEVDTNP